MTLLSAVVLFSCTDKDAERARQKFVQDSLLQVQQDSLLDVFRSELEDISGKVNEVSSRNGLITIDTTEGAVLSKEEILKQVESLDGLLSSNQAKLNDLYERMRQSNLKNTELERMITNMQTRIAEREAQVDKLMQMLADKDVMIEEIKANIDSMRISNISLTEDLIEMDEEMHLVHYIVGDQNELKESGLVIKEGGILGLGAAKKLNASNLNLALFTEADQRELTDVPVYSKKAKVITNHPEASYEWVSSSDGQVESLKILDRKSFWSVTDYLVIEVVN